MYSMNEITWDKPVDAHAHAASCCVKITIGVTSPVEEVE